MFGLSLHIQRTYRPLGFRRFSSMSRRSHPSSPDSSPRVVKRQKLEYAPLSTDDYKNGLMLAPMVRSGARECIPSQHVHVLAEA